MSVKLSISSHGKYRIFTCVQIPHFSVVEILVKHCSLYNKSIYYTLYALSVFSLDKILQLILEIN